MKYLSLHSMAHFIYTSAQIRAIENKIKAQNPSPSLMQRAGLAAALEFKRIYPAPATLLIFAGPGDNGGDAYEMAYQLQQLSKPGISESATEVSFDSAHASREYEIHIVRDKHQQTLSSDALASLARAQSCAIHWWDVQDQYEPVLERCNAIVDGIFGIGLNRPIQAPWDQVIQQINQNRLQRDIAVIALDIPSGLSADFGTVFKPSALADQSASHTLNTNRTINRAAINDASIKASNTFTFIGDKFGLHTAEGRDYAGQVSVMNLDISAEEFPISNIEHNQVASIQAQLQRRAHASHKGSYGDALIIGGAQGMRGAAFLAGRAALHAGAGKVHLGFVDITSENDVPLDIMHPEIMCRSAEQCQLQNTSVAIGPGLGQSESSKELLLQCLKLTHDLVIDADALNLIAQEPPLQSALAQRNQSPLRGFCNTIITPHPLEAARLLSCTVQEIQADRLKAATELAQKWNLICVLKGSGSLVTDGHTCYVNGSGNPGLASGGTGDVLTGLCVALLAQGLCAFDAARLACYVHGAAADQLVAAGVGPIGLCASELPAAIRQYLNRRVGEFD
ncbi:NAD(P)H-hydrate dehydratase [Undibacterium cyanobacteriorum]|uniref:ADP-dependent (S)-NAD(P)H-hydrate dehydratase n=1 Tax=Undibacterium cyanobacteriorum TaxID=3073561 RepID=A0ABY9RLW5_9BURK|nr:NAD(P)H-hydrate dehydratase [Undibacterium sp. 20NA77.5]WMW82206.1 NAD(P)H-hydrate dehydratase [Undibacterium sp. 20NA77.5]